MNKPIIGYENLYTINDAGDVYSLLTQQYLKKRCNQYGYRIVQLRKDNKLKSHLVHRLVYEAFKGPVPEGYQVNHLDENPNNPSLNNLNLLTPKQNTHYGVNKEKRLRERNKNNSKGNTENKKRNDEIISRFYNTDLTIQENIDYIEEKTSIRFSDKTIRRWRANNRLSDKSKANKKHQF